MKILILSTPKTGNVWLVQLLSHIYDLPNIEVPLLFGEFQEKSFEASPEKFIAHQHLFPEKRLIDWINSNDVKILTTIRHPASTLLSLINYTKHTDLPDLKLVEEAVSNDKLLDFIRLDFFHFYGVSLAWRDMGSFLVRYEDLLADPLSSLREITKILGPVPEEKIRAAVLICQAELITQIRLIPKEHIARFKKDYLRELPLEVCEAIINLDAFAKTYKEFEYDVDPQKGLKRFDYGAINPFKEHDQFDNGVSIDAFVKYIYYCVGGLERWTLPYITEGDSFWNWLFMPNDKLEKATIEPVPYYTNFLNFIYEYRRDLRAAFPDVLGIDYPLFLKWAFFQAPKEYRVSWHLFAGVRDYYLGTMPRLTWPGAFPGGNNCPTCPAASPSP